MTLTGDSNKALFETPAGAFYGKLDLLKGDGVLVSLAPSGSEAKKTTRLIPQALLFYYSSVCEEKFGSSLRKSDSNEELIDINERDNPHNLGVIDLCEWDAEAFDMALQWMYTGNVNPDIDASKHFDEIKSYKLRYALIAAKEKRDHDNNGLFTCNPVFKETLQDAFTQPINSVVRELLASFLVESYAKHLFCPDDTRTAKNFKDLFKAVDCLELEVLRLVALSLEDIALSKPKSDGFSVVRLLCPLTGERFKTEKMLMVLVPPTPGSK
ncbi:hypothetical protein SBOR_0700 [Sclerotinia borealis F-4128]|uniref:BTB domain-containing protein n=1 Tax=Sclerotinia borealis (strain F-4128) TaxID=1432307 RepID=W9CPY3_SCLBF|nr:hypothetical protein SBOR_0700 [Sclerotinia borealis F-4128]